MEKIKEKMINLRMEADEHASKVEEQKKKIKELEQDNLSKEQEITSLNHRNQLLESEVDKLETSLKEAKAAASEGANTSQQTESLTRRLQLLEEEAEKQDTVLKETADKLRMTDVKAGHHERKVQALEKERDDWEAKYEDMSKKHESLKRELDELMMSMGNL